MSVQPTYTCLVGTKRFGYTGYDLRFFAACS